MSKEYKQIKKVMEKILLQYIEAQKLLYEFNEWSNEKYQQDKDPLVKEARQLLDKM